MKFRHTRNHPDLRRMNTTRRYVKYLGLVALATLSCVRYVTVEVTNATRQPLHDLVVVYAGGTATISELHAETTTTVRIHPRSESSISIHYRDVLGREHAKDADVYLERDYTGTVTIKIESSGVLMSSNMHP